MFVVCEEEFEDSAANLHFESTLASQQGGSEVSSDEMRVVATFHSATSIDSSFALNSAAITRVAPI